jgi:hypothetical protein
MVHGHTAVVTLRINSSAAHRSPAEVTSAMGRIGELLGIGMHLAAKQVRVHRPVAPNTV